MPFHYFYYQYCIHHTHHLLRSNQWCGKKMIDFLAQVCHGICMYLNPKTTLIVLDLHFFKGNAC